MVRSRASRGGDNFKNVALWGSAATLGALAAFTTACSGPDCNELGTCNGAAAVMAEAGPETGGGGADSASEATNADGSAEADVGARGDSQNVDAADAGDAGDASAERGDAGAEEASDAAHEAPCDGMVAADGACEPLPPPCTMTQCGTSCVDTDTDVANCGRCGHDCLGGACMTGACQPFAIVPAQQNARRMTIDASNVYWSSEDPQAGYYLIQKAPLAGLAQGTNPTTLAYDLYDLFPIDIALFGNYLYWGDGDVSLAAKGTVDRVATATGIPQPLGTTAGTFAVAADETGVYWADTNGIFKALNGMPTDGGTQIPIASDSHALDLTLDQSFVYWRDKDTGIPYRAPRTGNGAKTQVGGGQYQSSAKTTVAERVVVDANSLYWTDSTADRILKASVSGSQTVVVAALMGGSSPAGIALDSEYVYWTTQTTGYVMRAPLAGLTPQTEPTTLAPNQMQPGEIAVDDKAIYWLVLGTSSTAPVGSIMKLAKP